ncbi:MAG: hypothetical protein C0626_01090 [Arcobacter sp.]|nr:MAG: hypothetical protein C0626_01090 [Arcobacter sp.]
MISSVSSGIDFNAILSGTSAVARNSLSYEQQQIIDDTLLNYDSNSLSQRDAQEIVAAFQDANIRPSKQLSDAMSSLGFDAKEVGDLAGVGPASQNVAGHIGRMPPPPPPQNSSEDEEEDEEYYNTVQTLMDSLFNNEKDETTNSLNTISDYTSRVLNLNDESKQDLINLFDKYSSNASGYSQDEANTLVKSYLSEMLNYSKNYNHSSFYA